MFQLFEILTDKEVGIGMSEKAMVGFVRVVCHRSSV